jgi:II/X family phage/plasmid replication protein
MLKESKASHLRNVKFLEECGFSRAYLKSFDPDRPNNVVPIVQMIDIDFSNQRPSWYVEPKAGFEDNVRLIKVA